MLATTQCSRLWVELRTFAIKAAHVHRKGCQVEGTILTKQGKGGEAERAESVMRWQERMEQQLKYEDITRQLFCYFDALHAFNHSGHCPTETARERKPHDTTSGMLKRQFGFSLIKRKSLIPNSGYGAFVFQHSQEKSRPYLIPALTKQASSWRVT